MSRTWTTNEFKKEFGLRVRKFRNKIGLTQVSLADRMGGEFRYIQRVEAGQVEPTVSGAVLLARCLETQLTNLIPDVEVEKRTKRVDMPGVVYFLEQDEKVKIGWTKHTAEERAQVLRTGNSNTFKILRSIPGTMRHEKRLHLRFARFRVEGEWFKAEPVKQWLEDAPDAFIEDTPSDEDEDEDIGILGFFAG